MTLGDAGLAIVTVLGGGALLTFLGVTALRLTFCGCPTCIRRRGRAQDWCRRRGDA